MSSLTGLSRLKTIVGFVVVSVILVGVVLFLPGQSTTQAYPGPDPTDTVEPPYPPPAPTDTVEPPYPPPAPTDTVEPPYPPPAPTDTEVPPPPPTATARPPAPTKPPQPPHDPSPTAVPPSATPTPSPYSTFESGSTGSNLPARLKTRESDPIVSAAYIVQPGDTLFRIALRAGTTVRAIQIANGLWSTTILAGQTLIIPNAPEPPAGHVGAASASGTYQVHAGDTLFRIARNHGMSLQALMAANHLTSPMIRAGQTLIIP